jgi:hypothetical protein
MKYLLIAFLSILSVQSFASTTNLVCNDQNGRSVFQLILSEDLLTTKLDTILSDSSVLSAGTKNLKYQEGESSPEVATYAGKTKTDLNIVLLFNAQKAADLKSADILEVAVYFQKNQGESISSRTELLCSKK